MGSGQLLCQGSPRKSRPCQVRGGWQMEREPGLELVCVWGPAGGWVQGRTRVLGEETEQSLGAEEGLSLNLHPSMGSLPWPRRLTLSDLSVLSYPVAMRMVLTSQVT